MDRSDLDISSLQESLSTLKDSWDLLNGVSSKKNRLYDALCDSCIQRFEYVIETSWKCMKRYLRIEYGKTQAELTVNNTFRFMEGYGLVRSWESWKQYYQKRNDTSHEYNIKKAREIIPMLPSFIEEVEFLVDQLDKALQK